MTRIVSRNQYSTQPRALFHFQNLDDSRVFEGLIQRRQTVSEFTRLIESPPPSQEKHVDQWNELTKVPKNVDALATALEQFSYDDIAELIFGLVEDFNGGVCLDLDDLESVADEMRMRANDIKDTLKRIRNGGAK